MGYARLSCASALLLVNAKYGFNGQSNDAHDLVPYGPNQWRVTDLQINEPVNPTVSIFDNNTEYTKNNSGLNIGTDGAKIGKKQTSNSEYFDGDIAEILVYDSALSDSDRALVRDYLDQKYALNGYAPPPPPTIDFDFEDDSVPGTPSLDGWTVVSQSNGAPNVPYLKSAASESNRMPNVPCLTTAWDINGPPGFKGDNGHDILIARSPEFEITAAALITWESVGGNAGGAVDPGTGTGPYPANAMGVSLVRASDGFRVMSVETAPTDCGTLRTLPCVPPSSGSPPGRSLWVPCSDSPRHTRASRAPTSGPACPTAGRADPLRVAHGRRTDAGGPLRIRVN